MRRFLIQLGIFLSPFIVFFGMPTYILWSYKENFYEIDKILNSKENYLIGYAHNEINYHYLKWSNLNYNSRRTVWALGSSRVLSFREKMFDISFYNAGYTVESLNDFLPFLLSIPDSKYPEYIIIGLDQWMFNSKYDDLNSRPSIESWQNSFKFFPKIYPTYKLIYDELFAGKYTLGNFKNDTSIHKIGLNAIFNNTGFKNDGSIFYGSQIRKLMHNDTTASDYKFSNTLDRIKNASGRFQYGQDINKKAILELDKILGYCNKHNIKVIAFLPPYSEKIFSYMVENDNNYEYLKEIYTEVKPFFEKYNFELYDFSNTISCNSSDDEMIDGFHGGELIYQKILISMLDSGSVLNKLTNVNRLKSDLLKRKNNYIIYD